MGKCLSKIEEDFNCPQDVKLFTLKGKYKAKVISVYDGDTLTAVIKYRNEYNKVNIRLLGYDAPELKPSRNVINRNTVIYQANQVKDYLSSLLLNKIVNLEIVDCDKYGNRWLGNIYINNRHINEEMLRNPYCKPYNGGKKS